MVATPGAKEPSGRSGGDEEVGAAEDEDDAVAVVRLDVWRRC
jgi:hypothetical protein